MVYFQFYIYFYFSSVQDDRYSCEDFIIWSWLGLLEGMVLKGSEMNESLCFAQIRNACIFDWLLFWYVSGVSGLGIIVVILVDLQRRELGLF